MEIAAYVTLFVLIMVYPAVDSRIRRLDRRVARIEEKLDLVMEQMGIAMTVPGLDEVERLARGGKTVEAVKVYRRLTDADLLEAKRAVDRMAGPVGPGA
ncbi:hypothetical protein [Streptomyces sp. NPDC048636]|uniref:hypothetical protein n=1 Tax=Streptomyces sp. NPDC048636 TaxID=3155762 RepID=UPI003434A4EE